MITHEVDGLNFDKLLKFLDDNPERDDVLQWLVGEANEYSTGKFGLAGSGERAAAEDSMATHGFTDDDPEAFWFRQVTQYFYRAKLTGVATPAGRQALMKSLMTLLDCCACMVRQHGLPPEPGHPSGEVRTWE